MINKKIVFLWYPGTRSISYFKAMIELDIIPQVIIFFGGKQKFDFDLIKESDERKYHDYIDLNYDFYSVIKNRSIETFDMEKASLNDDLLHELISSLNPELIIFTGGGVLKEKFLKSDSNWLHVHPGWTPDYKGSTCFYYSVIEESTLSATAFYLRAMLDDGPIIVQAKFRYEIDPSILGPLFIDQILDSFLRTEVLKRALKKIFFLKCDTTLDQNGHDSEMCYVIHPVLRKIAFDKLRSQADGQGLKLIVEQERS